MVVKVKAYGNGKANLKMVVLNMSDFSQTSLLLADLYARILFLWSDRVGQAPHLL